VGNRFRQTRGSTSGGPPRGWDAAQREPFCGRRRPKHSDARPSGRTPGWDEVGCQARGGPTWRKRGGSRPISRVLSRTTIHLGRTSPCASSDLPGSPCGQQERTRRPARFPIWSCSRWGLPCRRMLPPARCALTAPFHPYLPRTSLGAWARLSPGQRRRDARDIGGLLSVALSVGSRPPGITWHLALWSPDFPPRRETQRLPGRLPDAVYAVGASFPGLCRCQRQCALVEFLAAAAGELRGNACGL
jgi:hypothetical protein